MTAPIPHEAPNRGTAERGDDAGGQAAPVDAALASLVFVHIPKTAGGTITRIIAQNYPQATIYRIEGDNRASIQRLLALPDERRQRLRCVVGHAPVGLERYLRQPAASFTLLRDPVERVISLYHYILRRPTHYLHKEVTSRRLSLEAFALSSLTPELDNCQTRHLSGDPAVDCVFGAGPIDDATYRAALANVEAGLAAVGVQERFAESLFVFARRFGWTALATVSKNRAPAARGETPAAVREAIAARNAYDCALYQAANRRLDGDLALLAATAEEVAAVRAAMKAGGRTSPARALWWWLREGIETSPLAAPVAYRVLSLYRSVRGIKAVGGAERWQRS